MVTDRSCVCAARRALCAFLLVAFALSGCVAYKLQVGAHPSPNPPDTSEDRSEGINWTWLESQNPDIVGWLTIPESHVDTPIVRTRAEDEDWYLYHDFYGEPNFTGCPFIEPNCELEAQPCTNIVITGHNMGWNQEVFGDIACYADADWGKRHPCAVLHTPAGDFQLTLSFARTIPGSLPAKRTTFASPGEFSTWLSSEYQAADARYGFPRRNCCIVSLATCSYYGDSDDERTFACFAMEERT